VSFVAKNYVHNLGTLSCLIRGTIDIEDWDVTQEGLSVHSLRTDKIPVDEASNCSTVQEGLDRVEFICVHGSNFYQQEQGSPSYIQGTDQEELGQPLLPLGSVEQSSN